MNLDHKKLDRLPLLPTMLTALSANFNSLQEVDQLCKLDRLEDLHLQNNFITQLPDLSARLTNLNVRNNFIRQLPRLDQLKTVQLDNNEFVQLPPTLDHCSNLLNLSANSNRIQISQFPNWPLIRELSLDMNGLTCLPDLGHLISLRKLSLAHNKLADLGNICRLGRLEVLTLSHNLIKRALDLGDCPLKKLQLDHNRLERVQDLPRSLEYLYLNDNQLCEINLQLPRLRKLRIDNNDLDRLDLSALPKLEQVCACRNRLTWIKFGSALKQVLLSSNRLTMLPRLDLSQLSVLSVQHNLIKHLPLELINASMNWLDLNFLQTIC